MNEMFFVISSMGCFGVVTMLVFFGFFAYLRYIRYKETISLAEKGLVHPSTGTNGRGTLRWGIAFTAMGLALCMGLYPIGWAIGSNFPLQFGPWMLVGLIPAFFGLALVAIYYLTSDRPALEPKDMPFDELPPPEDEE
jgi:hypothetical protein